MANPFCHVELQTTDLEQARRFYTGLFDWKLQEMEMDQGTYALIDVGEGTGGGMMTNPVPDAPSQWLSYIQVEDVAASTKKAKDLGGTVLQDKTEVPNFGWLSIIRDPTGATFGLWQPT